jgi:hypothetical protein
MWPANPPTAPSLLNVTRVANPNDPPISTTLQFQRHVAIEQTSIHKMSAHTHPASPPPPASTVRLLWNFRSQSPTPSKYDIRECSSLDGSEDLGLGDALEGPKDHHMDPEMMAALFSEQKQAEMMAFTPSNTTTAGIDMPITFEDPNIDEDHRYV